VKSGALPPGFCATPPAGAAEEPPAGPAPLCGVGPWETSGPHEAAASERREAARTSARGLGIMGCCCIWGNRGVWGGLGPPKLYGTVQPVRLLSRSDSYFCQNGKVVQVLAAQSASAEQDAPSPQVPDWQTWQSVSALHTL
jgi:hypothetical protein